MTTATQTKPESPLDSRRSLVISHNQEFRLTDEKLCVADDILLDSLRNKTPINEEEKAFLHSLGFDDNAIRVELRRLHEVARAMELSGTAAEREATAQAIDEARKKSQAERPRLEARIAELDAQLKAVIAERDNLDAEIERHEQKAQMQSAGVTRLRNPDLLPKHEKKKYLARYGEFCRTVKHDLVNCETRLGAIKSILAMSAAEIIEHCRLKNELRHLLNSNRTDYNRSGWEQHANKLREEARSLEDRLQEIRPQHDMEKADIENSVDYYLR